MQIRPSADEWKVKLDTNRGITGPEWIKGISFGFYRALRREWQHLTLNMGTTGFATLFEWTAAVAMLEKLISQKHPPSSIAIDLIGSRDLEVLPQHLYIEYRKKPNTIPRHHDLLFDLSDRVYPLAGFLESLSSLDVLNPSDRPGVSIFYPGLDKAKAELMKFHGGLTKHTVVMGLTRIGTKEDCRQFLDEHRILSWKAAMEERFSRSPLFESEELWRVICHEIAVNIWEHSEVTGMMAARIVESPFDEKGGIKPWCEATYKSPVGPVPPHMKEGFLEVCVADAGHGIVNTLQPSYLERRGLAVTASVSPLDVLIFAFDELGTSKSISESWVTERHALGRILHLVSKYGGVLRVRSGKAEIIYKGNGARFERRRDNFGYEPQYRYSHSYDMPGTQLQLLLPLIPKSDSSVEASRRSVLDISLPASFHTQGNQVRGHLVPLMERLDEPDASVGRIAQKSFRHKCEKLGRELFEKRPRSEPLILDFSGVNWTPAQFETLLHLFQNILQSRPVLLVEIDPRLAKGVTDLERQNAPTTLDAEIIATARSKSGKFFGELPERYFLETYSRIHSTVLGVDRNGAKYVFGVPGGDYHTVLLQIVEGEESSIENLCKANQNLHEGMLRAILNNANPLFKMSADGRWSTVWDEIAIANETSRVMSLHFDAVAERSRAWIGRELRRESLPEKSASRRRMFYLPWLAEWRSDFLESARILSRGRLVDEVAQRLLYRLQKGLEIKNRTLADVRVLACVTTPSLLLAAALHRWWPVEPRPAVADLGYYTMLSERKDALPAITNSGGIIIVQDILDTKRVSNNLVKILREQHKDVICVLAFIRLETGLAKTTVTAISDGWTTEEGDVKVSIPRHAMIKVQRPEACKPPQDDDGYARAFWIEPRSLRAISYSVLRREIYDGRDPQLERRDEYLRRFDEQRLLTAGHYVYGRRHFPVTIDIRSALTGRVGDEIALWLADICEGARRETAARWESPEGFSFKGDVTAVLMPLHSQIHYIWPKVENLLAQRGRRRPNWWLEATLFIGSGPIYSIPTQMQYQIERAVDEAVDRGVPTDDLVKHPIRILIIDDSIATARTAETILTTILRHVEMEFVKRSKNPNHCTRPVEWIRYFAVLNQMSHAHHVLWHSLPTIGKAKTPIAFEEFAPFIGVPVYDEESCLLCGDRTRIGSLIKTCELYEVEEARRWAQFRFDELQPIAIDSPEYSRHAARDLPEPIDVIAPRTGQPTAIRVFRPRHADTAIWRFYELMYLSYPPNDILRSLGGSAAPNESLPEIIKEYDRYRWAVFEWCLHNWPRMEANAAKPNFVQQVSREVGSNSLLVPQLLEGCSVHYEDPLIHELVQGIIDRLLELELDRERGHASDSDRIERTLRLDAALTLFFLGVLVTERTGSSELWSAPEKLELLSYLDAKAQQVDIYGHSFLRNLHRRLLRPVRYAEPRWALETVAESLFRGRDPADAPAGNHKLLPRLITDIEASSGGNAEERGLLHGSLASFAAALEDLGLHCELKRSAGADEVEALCRTILGWLKHPADSKEAQMLPPEIGDLSDVLELDSEFVTNINEMFHETVEHIMEMVSNYAAKFRSDIVLQLDCDVKCPVGSRVLTHVHALYTCLTNLGVDPIKKQHQDCRTRIQVWRVADQAGGSRLCFRLLTSFAAPEEAQQLVTAGRSANAERHNLEKFGAVFADRWTRPSEEERSQGYKSSFDISVMAGFMPRR